MVSFHIKQKKNLFFNSIFYRFFNDVELKSTQKQTITSKQNIHTLTVNRTDQTDAGNFIFLIYISYFFF